MLIPSVADYMFSATYSANYLDALAGSLFMIDGCVRADCYAESRQRQVKVQSAQDLLSRLATLTGAAQALYFLVYTLVFFADQYSLSWADIQQDLQTSPVFRASAFFAILSAGPSLLLRLWAIVHRRWGQPKSNSDATSRMHGEMVRR